MKYTIRFLENSLHDFNKGIAYYKIVSEDLSEKFFNEFWISVEKLKENPIAYQTRYLNIRIIQVQKFPFTIHFFVEKDIIYVQRVLHDKGLY
ncbi:hypothetical protein [Lacinutrix salivirga]